MRYIMKKTLAIILLVLLTVFALAGCGEKELAAAQLAVDEYNAAVDSYNAVIKEYNEAVKSISGANAVLDSAIEKAQGRIDEGEQPYDPETLTPLKDALTEAENAKAEVPQLKEMLEKKVLPDGLKTKELVAFAEATAVETEEIKGLERPEIPDAPDYSGCISAIDGSLTAYEDSVRMLKQVTAPSDEFVMERLRLIDTITAMAAVTEDHDPNRNLGKQGGYIGAIFFIDSRVDQKKIYFSPGESKDDPIDCGTDGGGCIEVFRTVEEANARDTYLGAFDGTILASGSHYVIGTIVVRTSNYLKASEQNDLTEKIFQAFLKLD